MRYSAFTRHEPEHLDSSARTTLKRCPREFFFRYVLGYDQRVEPIYFVFGRSIHAMFDHFELAAKRGDVSPSATGMQEALRVWGNTKDGEARYEYCSRSRLIETCTLIASILEDEKRNSRIKILATEQAFNVRLPNGRFVTGRIDRILQDGFRIWGGDIKSTSYEIAYYASSLKPSDQFVGYTYAESVLIGNPPDKYIDGQYVTIVYNANHTKKEKKGPEVKTVIVPFTSSEIEEWIDSVDYWESAREAMRKNDLYPMNETACWNCKFKSVCKLQSERSQTIELQTNFTQRLWSPFTTL